MATRTITDAELYYLGDKVVLLGKNDLRERMCTLVKGIREIQKTMNDDKSSAELDELIECILSCKEPPEYGKGSHKGLNVMCYIDGNTTITYRPKSRNFLYSKSENGLNHHYLLPGKEENN